MTDAPSLPPVTPCRGCGTTTCNYAHTGGACWGAVFLEWEDRNGKQKHACRGHTEVASLVGGTYLLPTAEDLEVSS